MVCISPPRYVLEIGCEPAATVPVCAGQKLLIAATALDGSMPPSAAARQDGLGKEGP